MKQETSVLLLLDLGQRVQSVAERAVSVAILKAVFPTRRGIIELSAWLQFASASIASGVLLNADESVTALGRIGFLVGGVLLALSSICGLLASTSIAWFEINRRPQSLANGGRFLRFQTVLFVAFLGSVLLCAGASGNGKV